MISLKVISMQVMKHYVKIDTFLVIVFPENKYEHQSKQTKQNCGQERFAELGKKKQFFWFLRTQDGDYSRSSQFKSGNNLLALKWERKLLLPLPKKY